MRVFAEANAQDRPLPPTIVVPWPPTGNLIWRHAGNHHYISAAYKQYRKDVAVCVVWQKVRFYVGNLSLTLRCYAKDERARDLDNVCKGLIDALVKASVIEDDKYIDELHVYRMPTDKARPRVEVWITSTEKR